MDEWGVDCVVGASQKGLMLPTGMSFTGVSEKAMEAHGSSTLPKHYLSWTVMQGRKQQSFVGTVPVNFFFGLKESLRLLLDDEGLDEVFARHARLGEAVRRCVRHWSGNNGPQLYCSNPAREFEFGDGGADARRPQRRGHPQDDEREIQRLARRRSRRS